MNNEEFLKEIGLMEGLPPGINMVFALHSQAINRLKEKVKNLETLVEVLSKKELEK